MQLLGQRCILEASDLRLPRTHRLTYSPILTLFTLVTLALLLAACEGCTVAQRIDRAAHLIVSTYCAAAEPERKLLRARFNANSLHKVEVHCYGDLAP
jgi:hypothetical protein